MAESEEELKNLLMWMKEQSEKSGLKFSIKKLDHGMLSVSLFTLSALFEEPRLGEAQAKRREEDSRSCRKCRHVYSLLADAAAKAVVIT